MPYDLKARQLLAEAWHRVLAGACTELDILTVLILLREHASSVAVKEIAHFVAHRRRDRGEFHEYITKLRAINPPVQNCPSVMEAEQSMAVNPIFNDSEIFTAIDKEMAMAGFARCPASLQPIIVSHIISLLQDVRFVTGNKPPVQVGNTLVAFTRARVTLLARYLNPSGDTVIVPILSTENLVHPVVSQDPRSFGVVLNDNTVMELVKATDGGYKVQPR